MPRFGPLPHRVLIAGLRRAGFIGPSSRGPHPIMQRGDRTIIVPNPHRGDIDGDLLARILRQAGISRAEWEDL